jgi:hypothetical protein
MRIRTRRSRPTLDEREVLAPDLAPRQRLLQAAVHRVALGHDEQPRGVAVQAMDDARPPGVVAARRAPGQRLGQRALAVPARRMHDDAGRLVDDDEVLVLVGDREVGHRRIGVGRDARLRRVVDRHLLAGADAVVLAHGGAVDEHAPGDDQPLRPRARAERLREQDVEPLAGRLRPDLALVRHVPPPPGG